MRQVVAAIALVALGPAASAHFVFVYVEGAEARVVFGHAAAPDPSVFPNRAAKTALVARDAMGKETKLALEKGDGNFFRAKLPAARPVVIYGTNPAGVMQRGDNPPMLSWDYPKVIVGDPFALSAEIGKGLALEIVPIRDREKIRFKVLGDGLPLNACEVTVGLSGADEEKAQVVKTDKEGLTIGFAQSGRYCIAARRLENKTGEQDGKKYSAVRYTATLVADYAAK
jgi:uncharacterized GH25 family protein